MRLRLIRRFTPAVALLLALGLGTFAVVAARTNAAQAQPRLSIAFPQDGASIEGSTVLLRLATENLNVTDQGTGPDTPNEGHFHTFLDGRPFIAHYSRTLVFDNVAPGDHAIRVDPVINAHMQTIPGLEPLIVRFSTTGRTAGPRIEILEPQPGDVITGSAVTLRLGWSSMEVVEPGVRAQEDKPTEGHFHTTLDNRPFVAHYGGTQAFWGLAPGEHTIVVEPVLSSHMTPIPGTQPLTVTFTAE